MALSMETVQDSERLVREAQQGNAEAFGALYDFWVAPVYRYVAFRVGAGAWAEDLTEETFLRALEALGSFRWRGEGFLLRLALSHRLQPGYRRPEKAGSPPVPPPGYPAPFAWRWLLLR